MVPLTEIYPNPFLQAVQSLACLQIRLDGVAIMGLAPATYRKVLQNLARATGYNAFAVRLAAGVLACYGVLLSPAMGAILMSLSTVIVAINVRFLKIRK
jgi:Cu2+-exporting ATPase